MPNYVTDVIEKKYKEWDSLTNVFLSADTGTGKTTFLIEELGLFASRNNLHILYLCNRSALKDDVDSRMEELRKKKPKSYSQIAYNIQVDTYQHFEYLRESGGTKIDYPYDYIFCDEAHYFLVDSDFNRSTVTSLESILKHPCCKIWATATGKYFFPFLKKKILEEYPEQEIIDDIPAVEQTYPHVNSLKFYDSCEDRDTIIYNLLKSDPTAHVLVFTDKKMQFQEVDESFGDNFEILVSKSAISSYPAAERECIKESWKYLEKNHHQRKSIMFATTALDNGIDLKDKKLKAVFCELIEPELILQCLGRKRDASDKNGADSCVFYIKNQPEMKIDYRLCRKLETKEKIKLISQIVLNGDTNALAEGMFNTLLHSGCSEYIIFRYCGSLDELRLILAFNDTRIERLNETIEFLTEMKEKGFAEYLKENWLNVYLSSKVDREIPDSKRQAEIDFINALKKQFNGVYIGSTSSYAVPNVDSIRELIKEYLGSSYYLTNGQRIQTSKVGFSNINSIIYDICMKDHLRIIQFKKYKKNKRSGDTKSLRKGRKDDRDRGMYYKYS